MDINDDTLPTPNNTGDYCDEFSGESSNQMRKNAKVSQNYIDKYMR